jgi:hypothetical protein
MGVRSPFEAAESPEYEGFSIHSTVLVSLIDELANNSRAGPHLITGEDFYGCIAVGISSSSRLRCHCRKP